MKQPLSTSRSTDILFHLLADSRRRHVIRVLEEHQQGERLSLETLSTRLITGEDDIAESADELAVSLHHEHLPKLAEAGIITYDPTTNVIATSASREGLYSSVLTIAASVN